MAKRQSRRISNSSAYIGSGNKSSTFNQKARKPFQEIAEAFKQEIKHRKREDIHRSFKKLSEVEKEKIKNKIRIQQRKEARQRTYVMFLSLITGMLILLIIGFAIRHLYFN